MWANAQPNGRPDEYRWSRLGKFRNSLYHMAKFG